MREHADRVNRVGDACGLCVGAQRRPIPGVPPDAGPHGERFSYSSIAHASPELNPGHRRYRKPYPHPATFAQPNRETQAVLSPRWDSVGRFTRPGGGQYLSDPHAGPR